MATLRVPSPLPSPIEDAERLRKACQGWGTDEKAVISILAHRDATQRLQIRNTYEELYKENLIKRLESELSGDFEKAVYRWMFNPVDREAIFAKNALSKGLDSRVLIEISCIGSTNHLLAVKQAYQARYKRSIEEDVASTASGDLRKLLVGLVSTYRYDGHEVDSGLALAEAKLLHDVISQKEFDNEELLRIMTTRSKPQLRATFNRYKDEYGTSITKNMMSESRDEFASALRIVVHCIASSHMYFEKLLRMALEKPGTDEDTLTRVIVTRADKDLKHIKEIYEKRANKSLEHAINKETSGDYKNFLLALLGN